MFSVFGVGRTGALTQYFPLVKHVLYCMSHTSHPFFSGYFGDGNLQSICLIWPETMTLLISASHVVRIIGRYHWCLVCFQFF
jgi:hypothetical protein